MKLITPAAYVYMVSIGGDMQCVDLVGTNASLAVCLATNNGRCAMHALLGSPAGNFVDLT